VKELHEELLALSADAYSYHQSRGDSFALRVADVLAGLALKAKRLAVQPTLERKVAREIHAPEPSA
jgi:hypothetical protein